MRTTVFLAGDGQFGVVDLDVSLHVEIEDWPRSAPSERGALRLDDRTILTTLHHGGVYRIDMKTGEHALVTRFEVPPYSAELGADEASQAYVLQHLIRGQPAYYPIVMRVSGYTRP